ncbi:MAG: hypothetical protein WAN01_14100, partial [Bradyrhizobium sp.]
DEFCDQRDRKEREYWIDKEIDGHCWPPPFFLPTGDEPMPEALRLRPRREMQLSGWIRKT